MKKNVKAIFAGLAAAALLAGFSSCSNGSSDDSLNKPAGTSSGANQIDTNNEEVFSGDEISFVANVASYDSKDSVLIIKYDRTAEGSDDAISLTNVKLNVTVNGETIETPSAINFELDPYSSFDKSYNYASEETAAKQHDYKYKFNLGKKINVNDVVKVQLVSAKVTGAGASRVKLGSLTVSLIDVSQYATVKAYYTELCAENYKCLITKKNGADLNATVAVEEPANPTPANNTPENPAPANPTPENPTPATPENTSTNTNNTSTPAANTPATEVTIFEGEQTLAWTPTGTNLALDKDKFSGEKKTILVTYKKTGDGSAIQLINRTGWAKISDLNSKVTGSVAQKESAPYDELYPWAASEDGNTTEWTFTFTPSDDDWNGIVSEGFAVQGNATIITKVVLK